MARPIPFDAPPRDILQDQMEHLNRAPVEHAAALLDAYALLQTLHDNKVLDTLRGLIGSGEEVIDIAVQGASSTTAINAARNMLLLYDLIGSIEPDKLTIFTRLIPQAIQVDAARSETPSLWGLMKSSIFDKDFRRGLGAMINILRSIGMGLNQGPKK